MQLTQLRAQRSRRRGAGTFREATTGCRCKSCGLVNPRAETMILYPLKAPADV